MLRNLNFKSLDPPADGQGANVIAGGNVFVEEWRSDVPGEVSTCVWKRSEGSRNRVRWLNIKRLVYQGMQSTFVLAGRRRSCLVNDREKIRVFDEIRQEAGFKLPSLLCIVLHGSGVRFCDSLYVFSSASYWRVNANERKTRDKCRDEKSRPRWSAPGRHQHRYALK